MLIQEMNFKQLLVCEHQKSDCLRPLFGNFRVWARPISHPITDFRILGLDTGRFMKNSSETKNLFHEFWEWHWPYCWKNHTYYILCNMYDIWMSFPENGLNHVPEIKKIRKIGYVFQKNGLCHATDWNFGKFLEEFSRICKWRLMKFMKAVLFDDVKLQMEAKLYSELYNKYDPPKPIDIMQICIIKIQNFQENSKEEYLQMEHFIEGELYRSRAPLLLWKCEGWP